MQAIAVRDRDAGPAGLSLTDLPYPQAAENDVIVRVYAAGFTRGELAWAGTWTDRGGRDRTPSVPGHEVSGVVAELGYGTTGLTLGQRVFGLADWTRNGTLAEYVAVEARNLAPLPVGVEHAVAAGAVISGLTAWQALFDHAHLIQPENGRAIFFVVEADRSELAELAQWLRDGRLTSNVGAVRPLAEAPAAFGPDAPRVSGKTMIRVTEGW
jgi:NADPH:quinone reductase-like Zn-dependent oxidoreductase